MIAIDTNVLVHAHRLDSEWNAAAFAAVGDLAGSGAAWAIPWPCVHEFISVVTNPRMWERPTTLAGAIDQVEAWQSSPALVMLAESDTHLQELRRLGERARIVGGQIHDARIAVICLAHGVRELWTADRDFGRFPALRVRNPLTSDD